MSSIDNISKSFAETLAKSDLSSLVQNSAEIGIDTLMKDGIAKDIPIVGTVVELIKTTQNISNWLFLKKIIAFLKNIDDIDIIKREEMITKIDNDPKYRKKVGDQLLFIIDSCEDDIKSEYIAILFRAFITEMPLIYISNCHSKVTYNDFIKGSSIINRLTTSDFDRFVKQKIIYVDDSEYIGVGLAYIITSEVKIMQNEYDRFDGDTELAFKASGGDVNTEITEIGKILKCVFNSLKQK